ncbi:MAG TPA: chemotaxis protein CheB [Thermoanaerobaculia bacterium]
MAGPGFGLVTVAASAGGLAALKEILGALPADFPAPVAVVLHRTVNPPNLLPQVLSRWTSLRVKTAEEGERLRPGTIYVAPPDQHLLIGPDGICALIDGHQRILYLLSSADPLFSSAADVFQGSLIAVVLSGGGHDATGGVQAVKAKGGVVIAQDQATSQAFGMPGSAIETGCVDHVLPIQEIGPALLRLTGRGSL